MKNIGIIYLVYSNFYYNWLSWKTRLIQLVVDPINRMTTRISENTHLQWRPDLL